MTKLRGLLYKQTASWPTSQHACHSQFSKAAGPTQSRQPFLELTPAGSSQSASCNLADSWLLRRLQVLGSNRLLAATSLLSGQPLIRLIPARQRRLTDKQGRDVS